MAEASVAKSSASATEAPRIAPAVLAAFVRRAFELGATATAFEGANGHVTGVTLADGRTIACDAVVVGVGAAPNDELARDSGLEVGSTTSCEAGNTTSFRFSAIVRPVTVMQSP